MLGNRVRENQGERRICVRSHCGNKAKGFDDCQWVRKEKRLNKKCSSCPNGERGEV